MAQDLSDLKRSFYVYALFSPDTGQPLYVGKGKRNRCYEHIRQAKRCQSKKDHLIHSYNLLGVEVPVVIIRNGLTDMEAAALEILLIAVIGRDPDGPLLNLTDGGDGLVNPSPETLAKIRANHVGMSGRTHSSETRLLMSVSMRGKKRTEEGRQNIALAQMGKRLSEEHKTKIGLTIKGMKRSLETCAKISAVHKGKPKSPEHVAKIRSARHTEATKEKMRLAWRERRKPGIKGDDGRFLKVVNE